MADTDITEAQFKTELGAVKSAIRSGDWATAHRELAAARMTLAGLAKQKGDNQTQINYYREILNDSHKALTQAQEAINKNSGDPGKRWGFMRTGFN